MEAIFVLPVNESAAPQGFRRMEVPGCEAAFVDEDLAVRVEELLGKGQVMVAKSLMLWFGGVEKK
jgi:hypothetical protein